MAALLASRSDGLLILPFGLLVIGLIVVNLWWTLSRSASMLERHLRERGYRLVRKEYRWLVRGPFWWRTSKGQSVYRFTADDGEGRLRGGWARVGGYFFGLLSNHVDIRWDDEPKDRGGPGFPVVMPGDSHRLN